MNKSSDSELKEIPIDFTKLEKVGFLYGYGPLEPDRVYKDTNGQYVAFFSNEKCEELKRVFKQSTESYYLDNRALLFSYGHYIRATMESENFEGPTKGENRWAHFKTLGRSFYSAFGMYSIVTNIMMKVKDEYEDIFNNMYIMAITCNKLNWITSIKNKDYYYRAKKQYAEGIEICFGTKEPLPMCCIYFNKEKLNIGSPITLTDVYSELLIIEELFRLGNRNNSNIDKNIASKYLSKVSEVFHQNFERQIKYSIEKNSNYLTILHIRKLINYLVLSYRWMSVNVDFFDCGEINCLQIASPSRQKRYYLCKSDVEIFRNRLLLKVSTELCQYLGKFDFNIATSEYIEECLEKKSEVIENLMKEYQKINNLIEQLQDLVSSSFCNMAKNVLELLKSCILSGPMKLISLPSLINSENIKEFISALVKKHKNQKKKTQIHQKILNNNKFEQMLYLYFQLQFIKKLSMRYSGIILKIDSKYWEEKYNCQLLI